MNAEQVRRAMGSRTVVRFGMGEQVRRGVIVGFRPQPTACVQMDDGTEGYVAIGELEHDDDPDHDLPGTIRQDQKKGEIAIKAYPHEREFTRETWIAYFLEGASLVSSDRMRAADTEIVGSAPGSPAWLSGIPLYYPRD